MNTNTKLTKEKIVKALLSMPNTTDKSLINEINDICEINGIDWLYGLIKKYKIIPFAAHFFMDVGNNQMNWMEIHREYENRTKNIISKLDEIFLDFKLKGIEDLVLYENLGVVLLSNSCTGCFSSGDADISANFEDLNSIREVLKKHGFIDTERRGKNNSKIMMTFYNSKILEKGFYINCSWQPIARRFVFNNKQLKNRLIIARRNSKIVGNTNIKVLSANELMYFSILHIALGHYYVISPGYRLYTDIDRLARLQSIDWDLLFLWAKEDRMQHRFVFTLNISYLILNTPIPEQLKQKFNKEKKYRCLLNFIYDNNSNKFIKRGSRLEKLYIDFLLDDVCILSGLINRVINSFRL